MGYFEHKTIVVTGEGWTFQEDTKIIEEQKADYLIY